MAHATKKVSEIVRDAVVGRLHIAEFQRGFVWTPEKVKDLLDSLCKDYPLGAMLCWQTTEEVTARGPKVAKDIQRLWIVDGQQRATALCLLLGQKPTWFKTPDPWDELFMATEIFVNLRTSKKDEFSFSLPTNARRTSPDWYSARRILGAADEEVGDLVLEMCKRIGGRANAPSKDYTRIFELTRTLRAVRDRAIIAIEIDHDPVDVAEIFARLNSKGTRVNEGDVALAFVAVRQQGWVHGQLLPMIDEFREAGFDFDPSFLIRAMVAVGKRVTRLKDVPREFWDDEKDFASLWKRTSAAIKNTVRLLKERGVATTDLLPSRNALIPLFVLDDKFVQGKADLFKHSFRWFLRATKCARYSGSAMTTMRQDLLVVDAARALPEAMERLEGDLDEALEFEAKDFSRRYDEEGFLYLMLCLVIFERGAEDWITGQRLGYDKKGGKLTEDFRPQAHHFFPKAIMRKSSEKKVNSLANIAIISEGDNRKIGGNMEPKAYLEKHGIPHERVKQQVFPPATLWISDRFDDFIVRRSELLAKAMIAYVKKLT